VRLLPFILRDHGAMQEASASADYPHDDFGNGICTNSGRNPDQMRPRCGGVQEVDFPHDASVVARGARRTRGVAYTSFYLFGALGKNSLDAASRAIIPVNAKK